MRGSRPTRCRILIFSRGHCFPSSELSRLIEPRFRPSTMQSPTASRWSRLGWARLERIADTARKLEPIAAISWLEMRSYMVNTLLRDTDSVSMAQSLEVRVPLLDTPLVEFVGSLPDAARHAARRAESAAGRGAGDVLPKQVFDQRKRTFTLAVEGMAARSTAGANRAQLGRFVAGACASRACERREKRLAGFSCGEDVVVAAVVDLCFERMVPHRIFRNALGILNVRVRRLQDNPVYTAFTE